MSESKMANGGAKLAGFPIKQWFIRISCTLAAAAILAFALSFEAMLGVLIGGGIVLATNALFIWFAYRYRGARRAPQMVNSMYFGETVKLVVTAGSFAVVFLMLDQTIAQYSLMGFLILSVASWLISVRLLSQTTTHKRV